MNSPQSNNQNCPKPQIEELRPWLGSAIILMDLDAFFASVEQLDHPEWRGKPVIVGGDPTKRGVVSTASYEARKFGVHSAMPSSTAKRLCPTAFWSQGNFHRYREMSKEVMAILYDESPHLMQVSIDEAFLDITPTRTNKTHPYTVAKRIQNRVDALGITCSIGLGQSKSVAKIASNMNKPHGITMVYPEDTLRFLAPLDVGEMSGIGPVAQQKLHAYHINTLGDLTSASPELLKQVFGKNAQLMKDRAQGIDTEVTNVSEPAKSVSNEISFDVSLTNRDEIIARMTTMAHKVGRRLRAVNAEGTTLHLKIRYDDLTIRTCQRHVPNLSNNELTWIPLLKEMLDEVWDGYHALRLVGVGISSFGNEPQQQNLFSIEGFDTDSQHNESPLIAHAQKNEQLLRTNDAIAKRFGEEAIRFGHELKSYSSTTGSSAKNPEDYR